MAGKFNFVITADNNPALRAIRSLNRELYKINKPFRDISNSIRALGRESGFTQLIGAFKDTAGAAGDVASKIGSILTPLIAVTGFTSVAAIAGMAEHWGELSRQIQLTQFQTGMSQGEIQKWIRTGQMFGVTTETMTGTLSNFATSIRDAAFGRNQGLLGLMNSSQIGITNLQDRLGDPGGVMMEFLKKVQGLDPSLRHSMLNFAGLGSLEPMLMQGMPALEKMMAEVEKLGLIQNDAAVGGGAQFELQLLKTRVEVDNLGIHIAQKLLPILGPLIEKFDQWVQNDAEGWLENLYQEVSHVIDIFGGLNNVLILTGAIISRGLIVEVVNLVRIMSGLLLLSLGKVGIAVAELTFAAFPALGLAMVEVGAAVAAFGAALLATPVGWIIGGIALIAGAVWGLYKAYKWLTAAKNESNGVSASSNSDPITPLPGGSRDVMAQAARLPYIPKWNQSLNDIFNRPDPGIRLPGPNPFNNIGTADGIPQVNASSLIPPPPKPGQLGVNINISNAPPGTTADVTRKNTDANVNIHHTSSLSFAP